MHEEIPWYVSLIFAWLPFVFMLAVWYLMVRSISRALQTPDGRSLGQVISEVGAELRRSNDGLERLLNDHSARLDALEKSR
jgi:ATP-dependent Zn protease